MNRREKIENIIDREESLFGVQTHAIVLWKEDPSLYLEEILPHIQAHRDYKRFLWRSLSIEQFKMTQKVFPGGKHSLFLSKGDEMGDLEETQGLSHLCARWLGNFTTLYEGRVESLNNLDLCVGTGLGVKNLLESEFMSTIRTLHLSYEMLNGPNWESLCRGEHLGNVEKLILRFNDEVGPYLGDLARNSLMFENVRTLSLIEVPMSRNDFRHLLRNIPTTLTSLNIVGPSPPRVLEDLEEFGVLDRIKKLSLPCASQDQRNLLKKKYPHLSFNY